MTPVLDHDHVDDEMHSLNQEADYLDQTVTIDTKGVNGKHHHRKNSNEDDPDAQAQVIASLRSQIQDLYGQVTQLNNKLVRSYDRVSDLEDELHVTSTNLRNATTKVSQLEVERSEHLSALSTGLLVEKANVTSELTRLMEKATEEAARAGEAVSARQAIEKDLDDLSAGLFDQANTMVAEARLARARSEKKVEETENALRGAEEIVGLLQTQLQSLQSEKEEADRKVQEMRIVMGKGKWVERPVGPSSTTPVRLLCLHLPYLEFLQFLSHLRTIRPSTQHAPAMSTLLPLPFLARLITEDSDPTVRLDLAPSLNWLTRRSVLSAIHSGQLTIEPMSTITLLDELAPPSIPGHSHVACALCGMSILETPTSPTRPSPMPNAPQSKSWGPSFLKTSLVQTISAVPFGHSGSRPPTPTTLAEIPAQMYIFKLETTSSSGLPVSMPQGGPTKPATVYPLCSSGWCLARLRTTCSLWAFIRTGIVERIWEEEPYIPASTTASPRAIEAIETPSTPSADSGKLSRIGALWGTMSRSLSNTTKPESEKTATQEASSPKSSEPPKKDVPALPRRMPPPPPRHPPLPPPPVPERRAPTSAPPPLPKRNRPVPPAPGTSVVETTDSKEHDETAPSLSSSTAIEESHDGFATSSEELTEPTGSRFLSPTEVPLPPSEPSSPLLEATNITPESDEPHARLSTPPPMQLDEQEVAPHEELPSSAEPTQPAPTTDRVPEAPVATSGAPPPLPRRAANRGRPSSLAAQPPAAEAEAPEAAAPAPTPAPAEPKTEDAEHGSDEAKLPQIVTPAPMSPPAYAVDADDKSSIDFHSDVRSRDMVTVNLGDLSDSGTAGPSSDVSDAEVEDATSEVNLYNNDDLQLEEQGEVDQGVYVGETTWEERTWKELVRLRENMFWARIGSVR